MEGKISGCFNNSTSLFSSNVKIEYNLKERVLASYGSLSYISERADSVVS